MKNKSESVAHAAKPAGGIYKIGTAWILEFPAPLGVTEYKTLKAARAAARAAGLAPYRWYGCDAEAS